MMPRSRARIACAAAFVVAAAGCAHVGPAGAHEQPTVIVTQGPARSPEIPPDFIGLSYEKASVGTLLFDVSNTALVSLLRRLGPGVLRVGGNSVDRTLWDPTGPGLLKGRVAPADLSRLARFLRAADWRVLYGLNMGTAAPQAMAQEAAAAEAAFGDRLVALEIGNEPDLYRANGLRPPAYTFNDFLKEWENDARLISGVAPDAALAGPETAGRLSEYTLPFTEKAGSEISLLTHHYYRADGRLPTSSIQLMLSPDPRLPELLNALSQAARSAGVLLGFRLDEANSFWNGGAPHVSDSFASALWVIDFLFECAAGGASGVNLHGGGDSPGYTPIADNGASIEEVRPEYYGMLLFAMAAHGSMAGVAMKGTGPSISAWAVSGRDQSLRVVLTDASDTGQTTLEIRVPPSFRTVSLLELGGPSLAAEKGTLLGGAPIRADGSWQAAAQGQAAVRGGRLAVVLKAPGAILAIFRP
jgi:hypothetical protein